MGMIVRFSRDYRPDGLESLLYKDQYPMGNPESDRRALEGTLLKKVHEQSSTSPERAPFWREGEWRCEFHKRPGDERLKVFSGANCVHEESVPSQAAADARARELRRVVMQSRRAGRDDCLLR